MKNYLVKFNLAMGLVLFAVVGGLVLFTAGPTSADPGHDISICDDLRGMTKGLCLAGVRSHCADGTGNAMACSNIEQMLEDAGVTPPWLASLCPCDYDLISKEAVPNGPWEPTVNPDPFGGFVIVLLCGEDGEVLLHNTFESSAQSILLIRKTPARLDGNCSYADDVTNPVAFDAHNLTGFPEGTYEACRADIFAYAQEMSTLYPSGVHDFNCGTGI